MDANALLSMSEVQSRL